MDNSSDDEWRKKGVEFKIIDEGEKKKKKNSLCQQQFKMKTMHYG